MSLTFLRTWGWVLLHCEYTNLIYCLYIFLRYHTMLLFFYRVHICIKRSYKMKIIYEWTVWCVIYIIDLNQILVVCSFSTSFKRFRYVFIYRFNSCYHLFVWFFIKDYYWNENDKKIINLYYRYILKCNWEF